MSRKLYASHIKNCLDQSKIWHEFTADGLPDDAETDKLIENRMKLVEEVAGVRPYWTNISDFKKYPPALDLLKNRPIVLEYTGSCDGDWSHSTLNRLFDYSHQTLFTDSLTLAESVKSKIKGVDICCLIQGTDSKGKADSSLDGLRFYHWDESGDFLIKIRIFLDLVDAIAIAEQISDAVVLRGDNEELARAAADITEAEFQPEQLLAIPGNAGCYTNKLIKKYWNLCDDVEDIKEALEAAKKKREGK